jgi:hypothetical protein
MDEVQAVASEIGAKPAQVALAWLLAQGDDGAPIPGTKRVSRVEENTAADGIDLSAEQIQRLNDLTPDTGERHDEANMAPVTTDHVIGWRRGRPCRFPRIPGLRADLRRGARLTESAPLSGASGQPTGSR